MAEIILKTELVKEKGFIYYVTYDEQGKIMVGKAVAGRKKKV